MRFKKDSEKEIKQDEDKKKLNKKEEVEIKNVDESQNS